jgi:hypothetical protein
MGRRTRSTLPTTANQLRPRPIRMKLTDVLEERQQKQKHYYDKNTRAERETLHSGEYVRMRTDRGWQPSKVVSVRPEPRSYNLVRNGRIYRRNRRDIMKTKETPPVTVTETVTTPRILVRPVGLHQRPKLVTSAAVQPSSSVQPKVCPAITKAEPQKISRVSGRVIRKPQRFT